MSGEAKRGFTVFMELFRIISAFVLAAVTAYLLGSMNFAMISTKAFLHKDIRDFGSGNAGMTNVLRTLGKGPAALTLIGDFSKGAVAVLLGHVIFTYVGGRPELLLGGYVSALFALLGHLFPLYYGFKGGKGIATCAGVLAVLDWRVLLIILGVFLIVTAVSRYVSLGSVCAAVAYPVSTLILRLCEHSSAVWGDTIMAFLIAVIVIVMHRKNIERLFNGTENKIGQKKKQQPDT